MRACPPRGDALARLARRRLARDLARLHRPRHQPASACDGEHEARRRCRRLGFGRCLVVEFRLLLLEMEGWLDRYSRFLGFFLLSVHRASRCRIVFLAVFVTDETPDVPRDQEGLSLDTAFSDLEKVGFTYYLQPPFSFSL